VALAFGDALAPSIQWLAAGASRLAGALRDLVDLAWKTSAGAKLGWPEMTVQDALAGRADIWTSLYGKD
jgi:hypothetical protein